MQPIQNLYPLLVTPKKIVVTMHQKPDGDAMGSTLGLYHFLKQLGHSVTVISPTNWANFLNWMPSVKDVIDYERDAEKANSLITEADLLFCLDFNTLSRTKNMEIPLEEASGKRVLIDHHREPQEDKFSFGISDTKKSSTCEMVYDFIMESANNNIINLDIANCLYAGVMTDTGSFRFPSTTASVHKMVAHLKELGLEHATIHDALFDNNSESRLRFLGNVLLNRMELFYEYNTAFIAIPQSDLIKFDIKTGDTEGLVNFPLGIEGIRFAAIIIDRGEERKCSFRSKGDFDVNTFARTYFNGGGHFNAAGGATTDSLEKASQDFIAAMKQHREQLSTYTF
jgi:bifunctional oligoribonuclease and PAP phosphatase NrnA